MRKLLTTLFDIIFPPNNDERLVRTLTEATVGSLYREHTSGAWSACADFTHPQIRALIHEAKYGQNTHAQILLAQLLIRYLSYHPQSRTALWIPIPLSPARMRARGYNQVHEILKAVNATEPITILNTTLERTRDTRPQVELGREERLRNILGAFSVINPEAITNKNIIILDDVVTTGTTLHEAKTTLLPHHPRSITLLALAH